MHTFSSFENTNVINFFVYLKSLLYLELDILLFTLKNRCLD